MLFHIYGKPQINVSALKGLGILENRKNQITLASFWVQMKRETQSRFHVFCLISLEMKIIQQLIRVSTFTP